MRGARPCRRCFPARLRIIPADAGSTSYTTITRKQAEDHPRGCGEHNTSMIKQCHTIGSSPRMRGAHHLLSSGVLLRRIIPADAGSTAPYAESRGLPEDHPRGCGEHRYAPITDDMGLGSSPRMRGARIVIFGAIAVLGIIPADAGSTRACKYHNPAY